MPISYALVRSERLLLLRYSGVIRPNDLIDAIHWFATENRGFGDIQILSYCAARTEFSNLAPADFYVIRDRIKHHYTANGIVRRSSVFVVDRSLDARIAMPLWRAVYSLDPEFGPNIQICRTVEEACHLLACDLAVVEREMALLDNA